MKGLKDIIIERLHINKDTKNYNYHPTTRDEFMTVVGKLIKERGYEADLNDIDTSEITSMSGLFYNSYFNGDISEWDVSNVEDMDYMFYNSKFNGDISEWNISNVKTMHMMFFKSPLEKNPPKWYKE